MGSFPGDYTGDWLFDASDFPVWRKLDGTPQGYRDWAFRYGDIVCGDCGGGPTPDMSGRSGTPEPGAGLLLVVGLLLCFFFRRGR